MRSAAVVLLLILLSAPANLAAAEPALEVPPGATRRAATPVLQVVPDQADWTYAVGEPATFRVTLTADRVPIGGVEAAVKVGPELMPVEEQTVTIPAEGLVIDGGTMSDPGFIRCVVSAEIDGRKYESAATAGFSPERIQPTQTEPEDFDAFWRAKKEELAAVPMDAELTLLPEECTATLNVYHVSFGNVGMWSGAKSRIYGILCEPKAPGKYPAVLKVPGAGVRPYRGYKDLADKGAITLEIGIHGIPVNMPTEVYDDLRFGVLGAYQLFHLDHRDLFYFRRVYLGCIRANDFLTSREMWDGENLLVTGGSQGGQLSLATAALDPRVTGLAVYYPAFCDVTGYLHGRAGGWPHMFRNEAEGHRTEAKIKATSYYDGVNMARRIKVPGFYSWGYNDTTCPPTSTFAAYNVITAPKELVLALETPHRTVPEQAEELTEWLVAQMKGE